MWNWIIASFSLLALYKSNSKSYYLLQLAKIDLGIMQAL